MFGRKDRKMHSITTRNEPPLWFDEFLFSPVYFIHRCT